MPGKRSCWKARRSRAVWATRPPAGVPPLPRRSPSPTPGRGQRGFPHPTCPARPGLSHEGAFVSQGTGAPAPAQPGCAGSRNLRTCPCTRGFVLGALAPLEVGLSHSPAPRWPLHPNKCQKDQDPQRGGLLGACSVGQPGPARAESQDQGVLEPPTSQGSRWWGWSPRSPQGSSTSGAPDPRGLRVSGTDASHPGALPTAPKASALLCTPLQPVR
uniref:Uncharacterized protein n=1 Tax=Papio anubis TaxID=9555 RepID=A0A8I5N0W4_PAPAN